MTQPFLIAQISDLHIKAGGKLSYKKVDTLGALQAAIDKLNRLMPRPDIVVITGDLVDFGRDDEYTTLRQELGRLAMPYFVIPGNHDDRHALRRGFSEHTYLFQHPTFIQWVVDEYPVRLIGLDSTISGEGGGKLCSQRLMWLDQQLSQQREKTTLVMLHHPPFSCGITHMDQQYLTNPDGLAAIIQQHPQVERVLCGHVHRHIQSCFAGTLACSAPGLSHQVALNLLPDSPAHFVLEPAGFLLHYWLSGQNVVTHYCVVEDAEGPYPFFDVNGLID